MRCARCGNENLDGNRFCGMCGATLLTTSVPVTAPTSRTPQCGPPYPSHLPSQARCTSRPGCGHASSKFPILADVRSGVRAGTIY